MVKRPCGVFRPGNFYGVRPSGNLWTQDTISWEVGFVVAASRRTNFTRLHQGSSASSTTSGKPTLIASLVGVFNVEFVNSSTTVAFGAHPESWHQPEAAPASSPDSNPAGQDSLADSTSPSPDSNPAGQDSLSDESSASRLWLWASPYLHWWLFSPSQCSLNPSRLFEKERSSV